MFITSNDCQAQMFGNRTFAGQGMLQGNERFVRGNRSRRDFVGSSRSDTAGFVGAQQALATGRVRTAAEGLKIQQTNSNRINRPLAPQPAKGMYYPKLEVDFTVSANHSNATRVRAGEIADRLQERFRRIGGPGAQLLIEKSAAILRGTVDSKATAELLEQMLRFEPGIDEIRNELQTAERL